MIRTREGALGRNALRWASPTVPQPSAPRSGATHHAPDPLPGQSALARTAGVGLPQLDTPVPLSHPRHPATHKERDVPSQTPARLPYLVLMRIRQGKLQDAQDSAGWIPRTDNQPTNKGSPGAVRTVFLPSRAFPSGTERSRTPGSPCVPTRPELYTPHTLPRPHLTPGTHHSMQEHWHSISHALEVDGTRIMARIA